MVFGPLRTGLVFVVCVSTILCYCYRASTQLRFQDFENEPRVGTPIQDPESRKFDPPIYPLIRPGIRFNTFSHQPKLSYKQLACSFSRKVLKRADYIKSSFKKTFINSQCSTSKGGLPACSTRDQSSNPAQATAIECSFKIHLQKLYDLRIIEISGEP